MVTKKKSATDHAHQPPHAAAPPEDKRPMDAVEALKTGLIPTDEKEIHAPLVVEEGPSVTAPVPGKLPQKSQEAVRPRLPMYEVTNEKPKRAWVFGAQQIFRKGTKIDGESYSEAQLQHLKESGIELKEIARE